MELEQEADGRYIVFGDTYAYRDKLKSLGGRWSMDRKAWVFLPGANVDSLAVLVAQSMQALSEPQRERFSFQQELRNTSGGTHVRDAYFTGETFPSKALMQRLGAKWQSDKQQWLLSGDLRKDVVERALQGIDWHYYYPGVYFDHRKALVVKFEYDSSHHKKLLDGCECGEVTTCEYCTFACCPAAHMFEEEGFTGVSYKCLEHGRSSFGIYE